ncbi:unnamed protein product [Hymenolepis diminuta]|uniref:Peptidase S1 domain-containing protein n=1 Tax=Hymenolepis diminuta TaxID=6216 RepID=A0A564YC94_HYMDI|nr:unnamed protein product [Hymenolepis diminuta]
MFIFLQCFILHLTLILTFQKTTVSANYFIESEDVKNYSKTVTMEINRETTEEGERKDKMEDFDSNVLLSAVEGDYADHSGEILTDSAKDPFPYEHNPFLKTHRSTCGLKQNTQLKIIGGQEAKPHSWPWMVGLYRAQLIREGRTIKLGIQPHPFCGASLISPRHLVTASHCVMNLSRGAVFDSKHKWIQPEQYLPFSIVAKLGDHNTLHEEELSEEYLVQEVMHFQEESIFLDNDISLIKLTQPVTFSKAIQPICVPPPTYELPAGAKCTTVGWGCTKRDGVSGSPVLKEEELTVMPLDICRGFNPLVHDGQICAGGAYKTGGKGDSGGGFYCKLSPEDDQWYLFGVTSIGTPMPGPTIFASVPPLSNWINKNVDE